ncbi:MAG: hypothetical protein Q7J82_00150 [Coriobacteriia bacterium]|nr:hypothetical protein [Coriobacteriia bacterium]
MKHMAQRTLHMKRVPALVSIAVALAFATMGTALAIGGQMTSGSTPESDLIASQKTAPVAEVQFRVAERIRTELEEPEATRIPERERVEAEIREEVRVRECEEGTLPKTLCDADKDACTAPSVCGPHDEDMASMKSPTTEPEQCDLDSNAENSHDETMDSHDSDVERTGCKTR